MKRIVNLSGLWWASDMLMSHKPLPPEKKPKKAESDFEERLQREIKNERQHI
jgi:hypothetical protein